MPHHNKIIELLKKTEKLVNDEYVITGFAVGRIVFIDGKLLKVIRSQQIYNHSPDGFNWGYLGSGPAQLSLAILHKIVKVANRTAAKNNVKELLTLSEIKELAVGLHQTFKTFFVGRFPSDDFEAVIKMKKFFNQQIAYLTYMETKAGKPFQHLPIDDLLTIRPNTHIENIPAFPGLEMNTVNITKPE